MKIAIVVASNGLVAKELLHVAEDTVWGMWVTYLQ